MEEPAVETDAIQELVRDLTRYNEAYRKGETLISDGEYDALVERLRGLAPDHPFLSRVEPEEFGGKQKIRHPRPMLSIRKAYTRRDLELFVARVEKAAAEIGMPSLTYQVTAKLDGVAGRDDGRRLVTRGDGIYGFDVSDAFAKGVVPWGGRGGGLGEIVMDQAYFDQHLADQFKHPRNLVVGIIKADKVNTAALQALKDKAVKFIAYDRIHKLIVSGRELIDNIETIYRDLLEDIPYPADGIVAQVEDEALKAHMGATEHHYKWQIAFKKKGDRAQSVVREIIWQVGRTGNITPVLKIEPVTLSGATIQRVTGHHAGLIRDKCVGPGARIELIRSGEVIPKLEQVLQPAPRVEIETHCPSCRSELHWRGDFLRCTNHQGCYCQVVQGICHWFRILGNADWFGIKTVEKLVFGGLDGLERLYAETTAQGAFYFEAMGFGAVQSQNLVEAIQLSLTEPVEDWRFLAALGIPSLGVGDSRKLLARYPLERLPGLSWQEIAELKGFGEIKGRTITTGLKDVAATVEYLATLDFNMLITPLAGEAEPSYASPIAGQGIVFTGKMVQGKRPEMQALARDLGAKVQTAVSGATAILVCGERVGARKLDKARDLGVRIISEAEFFALIGH